jgi:hypothetical protein
VALVCLGRSGRLSGTVVLRIPSLARVSNRCHGISPGDFGRPSLLLIRVFSFDMSVQQVATRERDAAEAACEGRIAFRASVKVRMSLEVLMAGESTVADIALERLFSARSRRHGTCSFEFRACTLNTMVHRLESAWRSKTYRTTASKHRGLRVASRLSTNA